GGGLRAGLGVHEAPLQAGDPPGERARGLRAPLACVLHDACLAVQRVELPLGRGGAVGGGGDVRVGPVQDRGRFRIPPAQGSDLRLGGRQALPCRGKPSGSPAPAAWSARSAAAASATTRTLPAGPTSASRAALEAGGIWRRSDRTPMTPSSSLAAMRRAASGDAPSRTWPRARQVAA